MTPQQLTFLEYAEMHWLTSAVEKEPQESWVWLFRSVGMPL